MINKKRSHRQKASVQKVYDLLLLTNQKLDKQMANTEQAVADLKAIKDQLTKIGTESATLLKKIADLEAAAKNTDTPQTVLDAIADVKKQAQIVDDEVPDAVPVPPAG